MHEWPDHAIIIGGDPPRRWGPRGEL